MEGIKKKFRRVTWNDRSLTEMGTLNNEATKYVQMKTEHL